MLSYVLDVHAMRSLLGHCARLHCLRRYLTFSRSDSCLYGRTVFEEAQVDAWIDELLPDLTGTTVAAMTQLALDKLTQEQREKVRCVAYFRSRIVSSRARLQQRHAELCCRLVLGLLCWCCNELRQVCCVHACCVWFIELKPWAQTAPASS